MTTKSSDSRIESFVAEPVSRRGLLKKSGIGAAALALGVPAGLSMLSRPALAQGDANASLIATLQLKYMAEDLYGHTGKPAMPTGVAYLVDEMLAHEQAHIALLKSWIGSSAPAKSSVVVGDWTGGGAFTAVDAGATLGGFFELSRFIEDLSVRALKAAIAPSFTDATRVSQILAMNTVDARHAAIGRSYRAGLKNSDTDYNFSASSSNNLVQLALIGGTTSLDLSYAEPSGEAPTTGKARFGHYVYGPADANVDNGYMSSGEDNRLHAHDAYFTNNYMTDEPVAPTAVDNFLAGFGV